MTNATLTPEANQLVEQAEALCNDLANYEIKDSQDYLYASEDLKKVKAFADKLDTERKKATKPLDEAKKVIMDWFRKPLTYLTEVEANIKKGMITYQQAQEAIRKEQEAKLQAEVKSGETLPVVPSTVDKVEGISIKQIWKYRVSDANAIPKEYLIPDDKKLGMLARDTKGALKIAGIEFYSEDIISATKGE